MNYLRILLIYIRYAYKVYWLSRKLTKGLIREARKHDYVFNEELLRRINFYTAQCYIFGSWFATLRGHRLQKGEKKKIIYLGAITPILDDHTDKQKHTSSDILRMLENKTFPDYNGSGFANYLYEKLAVPDNSEFIEAFKKILIAQDESIHQLEARKLPESELRNITAYKGGMSARLYRIILENSMKPDEDKAILTLGYIMQLINDMFDIYKDNKNKQQTLFTNSTNLKVNYDEYKRSINKLVEQFSILEYDKRKIRSCLTEISTILSRGMVCMHQLLILQNEYEAFDINHFTRKQLICDMEKLSNLKRSIAYSVQFLEKINSQL